MFYCRYPMIIHMGSNKKQSYRKRVLASQSSYGPTCCSFLKRCVRAGHRSTALSPVLIFTLLSIAPLLQQRLLPFLLVLLLLLPPTFPLLRQSLLPPLTVTVEKPAACVPGMQADTHSHARTHTLALNHPVPCQLCGSLYLARGHYLSYFAHTYTHTQNTHSPLA